MNRCFTFLITMNNLLLVPCLAYPTKLLHRIFAAASRRFAKLNRRSVLLLTIAVVVAGCSTFLRPSSTDFLREVIPLDGTWQIAEGHMEQLPTSFEHSVPVPGLVSLARPAFVEPGPIVKDRQSLVQ